MAIESDTLITSFYTDQGIPATGLTPTIDIWEVTPGGQVQVITGVAMAEVSDGWYKYNFTTYDTDKNYLYSTDGGGTIDDGERYQAGGNESFKEDIADAVWDETLVEHLGGASTGFALAATQSDAAALRLDVDSVLLLVQTLLKYESNRTKINKTAKTLTVYDDDGTSILQVFDLFDGTGSPSVDEVTERVPQ